MDKRINKKRRFVNQISNGILEKAPQITKKVKAISGNLQMSCPSRSDSSEHKINISVDNNDLKFECDCTGNFSEFKTGFCIHIRSIVIKICNNYIDKACDFTEKKDSYVKLKNDIDNILTNLDTIKL